MSNMSYCRFQNTLADLRDCTSAIEDQLAGADEALSDSEAYAARKMIAEALNLLMLVTDTTGVTLDEMVDSQRAADKAAGEFVDHLAHAYRGE